MNIHEAFRSIIIEEIIPFKKEDQMIKNIVFDISNVLAPFRFKEFLVEKGFDAAMIKRIIKASAMTPYWTECISFIERFDGCVFSFREGIVKPDPEIYKVLLRRYGLKAEECVFIDDTEENVRSAQKLGMAGIVFTGYEEAKAALNEAVKNAERSIC